MHYTWRYNMKKIKIILLSSIIVFTFSACKNKDIDSKKEVTLNKVESINNNSRQDTLHKESNKISDEKKDVNKEDNENNKKENSKEKNEVKSQSKILNKVIVLDPGHASRPDLKKEPVSSNSKIMKFRQTGGADGVVTKTPEYKINMNVALKLKKYLEEKSFTVIMTKTDNNKTMSNIERAKVGNNSNAALVIRLHADSSDNKSVNGASVLIPSSSGRIPSIYKVSRTYGENIINILSKEVGMKNRGVIERSDLTGFNWSKVPVILVEMGFLSNPEEDKKLSNDIYQDNIAKSLSNGVCKIFK
ncbi:N-acetylmuramoyl-L-alanine amidase [Clostridium botulinum]|uniref:N-acetylmuramoyl-L-alanine amidase n=2 Tax=Clostridium botulinum TaxID=1491 RepID=A0A0A0I5P2_CLOBO|nr:N-acetylmuramoyl-L-alanine amidase [Clostridium botulinum C/D str. DC5]KOC49430.1 N-acetylmuramoyl-L-alanine amidase [Clostridium botulinum]MCD3235326.1 N-acetylmuramoyl-L-alanine amidase [Clostridium botulinum D/C]KOC53244.1 N-acetylmuramoyl-L-alanine amidase [Clostridium botulinum]MCD3241247.1 N-acetylmuramoyl-L-alanine amidase [Clostridium botulinum D/C]